MDDSLNTQIRNKNYYEYLIKIIKNYDHKLVYKMYTKRVEAVVTKGDTRGVYQKGLAS